MKTCKISFKIKSIKIFNTVLFEWKKTTDNNPVSFIAIRPELEGYVWHSFEFGVFIDGEWITSFTGPIEIIEGYYDIYINNKENELKMDVLRDGVFISSSTICRNFKEHECFPFLVSDKRNHGIIVNYMIDEEKFYSDIGEVRKKVAVLVATKDHLEFSKSSFYSLVKNAKWSGDLLLITEENIDEEKLKEFKDNGIYILKKKVKKYSKSGNDLSDKMLLKLNIFSMFFKKWQKVLYLDLDVIIRGDLDNLVYTENFSAIPSPVKISKKIEENSPYYDDSLDIESFCAAIMCFDTKIINKDLIDEIEKTKEKYAPFCRLGDEPILNIVFKKWEEISKFYSGSSFFYKNIISYHCRKPKPWKEYCLFHNEWKKNLEGFNSI